MNLNEYLLKFCAHSICSFLWPCLILPFHIEFKYLPPNKYTKEKYNSPKGTWRASAVLNHVIIHSIFYIHMTTIYYHILVIALAFNIKWLYQHAPLLKNLYILKYALQISKQAAFIIIEHIHVHLLHNWASWLHDDDDEIQKWIHWINWYFQN